jgi:sugar (pentulose or hexulose) kinase
MLKEMMEWEDEMSDMVCNEVEKLRDKFPALYIARREQLLLWATISRMKWTLRRQIQPISKMETDALVWS